MIVEKVPVYSPLDVLPHADVLIVTPVYEYEAIVKEMKGKICCPIVSIKEIIEIELKTDR